MLVYQRVDSPVVVDLPHGKMAAQKKPTKPLKSEWIGQDQVHPQVISMAF